jgi:hypothetical protein
MSTRPVAPDHIPEGWQEINRITNRLAVPGGWIYEVSNAGVVFVPRLEVAYSAAESGTGKAQKEEAHDDWLDRKDLVQAHT